MFIGLSLDQAPPFEAPLKFFLSAPIFAILGGFIALFSNGLNLYANETIAIVHIFTLGFMVMIIFGALQQMLPVVAGAVIPKPKTLANFIYITLVIGIFSFFIGFSFYEKSAFFISAVCLLLSTITFSSICLYQLLKVKVKSPIVEGMILSLIFFIFAILIGIHLEISHGRENINSSYSIFTTLHYNFIFVGFIFLLIASITFQVVPMFWVTKPFKKTKQKLIIYFTTFLLLFFSILSIMNIEFKNIYNILLSFISIYFASETLKAIFKRKRKLKDISIYYYATSMVFLIIGIFFYSISNQFELRLELLGVFLGLGFIVSLMTGMLYKIVPFLTWFHLSSKGLFDIPTMRDMIPIKHIEKQYYLHIGSIGFFTLYFLFDNVTVLKLASLLLILSNLYLFINLFNAAKVYLSTKII